MKKELFWVLTSVPVGANIFVFLRGLLEGGRGSVLQLQNEKLFFLIMPFNPIESCELGQWETRAVVLWKTSLQLPTAQHSGKERGEIPKFTSAVPDTKLAITAIRKTPITPTLTTKMPFLFHQSCITSCIRGKLYLETVLCVYSSLQATAAIGTEALTHSWVRK